MSRLPFEDLEATIKLLQQHDAEIGGQDTLAPLLHAADRRIPEWIAKLDGARMERPIDKNKCGNLLEELSLLLLQGCSGIGQKRSWTSATSQYDLYVDGNTATWVALLQYLHLNPSSSPVPNNRGVVVESKAWNKKIGVPHFLRMCSILDHTFRNDACLGILLTLKGASGFPGSPQTLRQCRLLQALFYAYCSKPIVIFDIDDLRACGDSGQFLVLLRRKIEAISEQAPSVTATDDPGLELKAALPEHLAAIGDLQPIEPANADAPSE